MKAIYLLTIYSTLLFSSEFNQKFNSLSKKYCIDTQRANETLCLTYNLKFPYSFNVEDNRLKKLIVSKISKYIDEFKKSDPKKELLEGWENEKPEFGGNWYDNTVISIYSVLPNSFTLEKDSESYMGGAHGIYGTLFLNYNHRGKKIDLDDIVTNIKSFTKEVESYYRDYFNISKDTPLSEVDWFEDKFILANEFALDKNGIYFVYNPYEIKAYAAGQTELLVPYSKVKKYINSKYLPKKQNKKIYNLSNEFKLIVTKLPNYKLQLKLKIKAPKKSKRAWVSIAFPNIYSKRAVINSKGSGFKKVSIYPKGSKIYNKESRKAKSSKYLLVEGYATNWKKREEKSITLKIKANKEGFIDIRAVFDKTEVPEYTQVVGQQGFNNFRIYYGW